MPHDRSTTMAGASTPAIGALGWFETPQAYPVVWAALASAAGLVDIVGYYTAAGANHPSGHSSVMRRSFSPEYWRLVNVTVHSKPNARTV
jgi:hypothetical protein